jgi:hypothetical protein
MNSATEKLLVMKVILACGMEEVEVYEFRHGKNVIGEVILT